MAGRTKSILGEDKGYTAPTNHNGEETAAAFDRTTVYQNGQANGRRRCEVPIWEKLMLSLEEAAAYSGIGVNKLREITNDEDCKFVVWNGSKRMIKRKQLDEFIAQAHSI